MRWLYSVCSSLLRRQTFSPSYLSAPSARLLTSEIPSFRRVLSSLPSIPSRLLLMDAALPTRGEGATEGAGTEKARGQFDRVGEARVRRRRERGKGGGCRRKGETSLVYRRSTK
jgi:hypothetical protein